MVVRESTSKLENAYEAFIKNADQINARHNNPNIIFSSIQVEMYEQMSSIFSCASIVTIDNITYKITPYDPSSIKQLVLAIDGANKGFSVVNKGDHLIVKLPPLTVERRNMLVKELKEKAEAAKVRLRQVRHGELKKYDDKTTSEDDVKKFKKELTDVVKNFTEKIDLFVDKKTHSLLND